ncbi:MAG: DUF86 domain-containing protein [Terrimicrobiaceae bacterium]|nr:DUF86 domain-containing protein [Terrimicrobiaceae bacterium]
MRLEVRENLEAVLEQGRQIQSFVFEMDFAAYRQDARTRLAVERSFEIIGEALNRVSKVEPETIEFITDFRQIISFRNILAHCYDSIEDKIVWGIVEAALPRLVTQVEALLPPRE